MDTLPKLREAGLALSAVDGTELGVAEVEFVELVVTEVELPLAEVTPAQPERINTDAKRMKVRKTMIAGELGRPCRSDERNRQRKFPHGVSTMRRVYGAHTVRLYWSAESIRYRCSGVFGRAFGAGQ
jgi:hypothetical protein